MVKICEVCGGTFDARGIDVKTCSPACKRKLQAKIMLKKYGRAGRLYGLADKVCMICNKSFEPSSGNQLTCSNKCAYALKRRRSAERRQAPRFSLDAIEPSYLERLEGTVLEGCRNSEELNRRLDDIQRADFKKFIRENAADLAGKVSPFFLRLANALRPVVDAAEAEKEE